MRTETIISVLRDLNHNRENEFELEHLSQFVDYATYHSINDKNIKDITDQNANRRYYFYLIRNNSGTYVAAVYEMMQDLHWVVLPEYRRKNVLIDPLKKTIIPHLFLEMDEILITIDKEIGVKNFRASEKIAMNVGFTKIKVEDDVSFFVLKIEQWREGMNGIK